MNLYFAFFLYVTIFYIDQINGSSNETETPKFDITEICYWSKEAPKKAPTPKQYGRLHFCSNYNDESCCTLGHDNVQETNFYYAVNLGFFCPYSRLSYFNNFPEFRQLFCLPCDPNQPNYMDPADGKLKICLSFAQRLLGTLENKNLLSTFDQCGLRVPPFGNPCNDTNGCIIMPSDLYLVDNDEITSYENFFNGFNINWRSPDFKIVNQQTDKNCFNNSNLSHQISYLLLIFFTIICIFL